jgi:hypothetical protein
MRLTSQERTSFINVDLKVIISLIDAQHLPKANDASNQSWTRPLLVEKHLAEWRLVDEMFGQHSCDYVIWPKDIWHLAKRHLAFGQKAFGIWHLAYLTFGEHLLYYVILSCWHDVFMTSFGQNTFGYNVWLAFLVLCHFGCQTWYFVDTFVTLSFGRKTLRRHDT